MTNTTDHHHNPDAGPIVEAFLVRLYTHTDPTKRLHTVQGFNTDQNGGRFPVTIDIPGDELGDKVKALAAKHTTSGIDVLTMQAAVGEYFRKSGRTAQQWNAVELVLQNAAAFEHHAERFAKFGDDCYAVVVQPVVTITKATECPRPRLAEFVRIRTDSALIADAAEAIQAGGADRAGEVLAEVGRRGLELEPAE